MTFCSEAKREECIAYCERALAWAKSLPEGKQPEGGREKEDIVDECFEDLYDARKSSVHTGFCDESCQDTRDLY